MNRLLLCLLLLTPMIGVAAVGAYFLWDAPPETATAPPDGISTPCDPDPEIAPEPRAAGAVMHVAMQFAVKPKELSPAVKKGLEYLVKGQQEDGGWSQGGGWRTTGSGGGRVEGPKVEDPSDIGNTSLALLALVRAGNTPTEGAYKDAVKKGLAFVVARIEKADTDSLYVTDVRNTQLQSKIGPYVDTFLANLLLAELKGKSGEQNKALVAALDKTMKKIVKHQGADGNYAGNGGWAPVLSVGIANKSIARANLNGVSVDGVVLERAFAQSNASANGAVWMSSSRSGVPIETTIFGLDRAATFLESTPSDTSDKGFFASLAGKFAPARGGYGFGGGGLASYEFTGLGVPGTAASSSLGDAGVSLYRIGQGAGNSQDIVNSLRIDGKKAEEILKDSKATRDDKEKAEKRLGEINNAVAENSKVQGMLAANVRNEAFVAGFGSNGGEEFLSFLNISESLLLKGGKDWEEWDAKMVKGLEKAQDKDGSWAGQHCITGKTFCTAGALMVLMADRTPFPPEVLVKAEVKPEPSGPALGKK